MLSIDNEEVRASQIARLERIRSSRDEERVRACLRAITDLAETPSQPGMNSDLSKNFLGLAVEAAKARATVGEITQVHKEALEIRNRLRELILHCNFAICRS